MWGEYQYVLAQGVVIGLFLGVEGGTQGKSKDLHSQRKSSRFYRGIAIKDVSKIKQNLGIAKKVVFDC